MVGKSRRATASHQFPTAAKQIGGDIVGSCTSIASIPEDRGEARRPGVLSAEWHKLTGLTVRSYSALVGRVEPARRFIESTCRHHSRRAGVDSRPPLRSKSAPHATPWRATRSALVAAGHRQQGAFVGEAVNAGPPQSIRSRRASRPPKAQRTRGSVHGADRERARVEAIRSLSKAAACRRSGISELAGLRHQGVHVSGSKNAEHGPIERSLDPAERELSISV